MCGITGIVGRSVTEASLQRSARSLRHRGPDGHGVFVNDAATVGLAHTRLSIIDLTNGAQPLFSEDRRIVLVVNGEIYDYERIRDELVRKGHRFRTRSDSEVVIGLYREYGVDAMFEHMRGEFALLLYDEARQLVIAARDRFGIKPLFVAEVDGTTVFSSEAKGIFATGVVAPELDPVAIRNHFSGAVPDSLFRYLRCLVPGTYMTIDLATRTSKTVPYWRVDFPREVEQETPRSFDEYRDAVTAVFDESVSLRLRADVPVGVYLSGGIDSTSVVATASRYAKGKLHAFTVSFTEDEGFDELPLAKKTAAAIGAELHVVSCTNDDLARSLTDSLWFAECPADNLHGVAMYLLSKLAKEQVSVVLTGDGGDEVFAGYDAFKSSTQFLRRLFELSSPSKSRSEPTAYSDSVKARLGFIPQSALVFTSIPTAMRTLHKLFRRRHHGALEASSPLDLTAARIEREQIEGRSWLRQMQYLFLLDGMPQYILAMLGDRPQMAHSVEGRVPLLDHRLFEAVRRMPDDTKLHGDVEKHVFREAMKERVLPEIYTNKKHMFMAPPVRLFGVKSPAMAALVKRYLSKRALDDAGVFDPKWVWVARTLAFVMPEKSDLSVWCRKQLFFVLGVQILHQLYVRDFDANVDRHAAS